MTTATGEIDLKKIIKLGVKKYLEFKDKDIISLNQSQLGESKVTIELYYYCNIINQLESNNYRKYYIIKDTTCSMAQHAGKLLGYNENNLYTLNLYNSDFGYDTYQTFINKLKDILREKYNNI